MKIFALEEVNLFFIYYNTENSKRHVSFKTFQKKLSEYKD